MMSYEKISDIWFRVGGYASALAASDLRMFRAIEREATAPLIEQIKEDEELMRQAMEAMGNTRDVRYASIKALRQRLETKK